MPSDPSGTACVNCGAPIDVTAAVSDSGWQEQPPVRDMARIQCGSSTCQIEGTYVPVVDFKLGGTGFVYFSHHNLLWSEPTVRLDTMPMAGGWNRSLAGMPLVMMQASGQGHIALSEDHPGEVVAIPLQPGWGVQVREHRFLAATDGVEYTWQKAGVWFTTGQGNETQTHYPVGMFMDLFTATNGPGLLLLHSPGNTFVRDLREGESICMQPTSLLYKDRTVAMSLHLEYPNTGGGMYWGSSYQLRQVWLRLRGPGRVAMQSVFTPPEGGEPITGYPASTTHMRW